MLFLSFLEIRQFTFGLFNFALRSLLGLFYKAMQKNESAVNPSRKQDTVVNRSKFPNLSVKVFGIFFGEIGAVFG